MLSGSVLRKDQIKRIAADEDQACDISALTSQLFQLDAVFFFPAQVFNLSGSYAERGAVQGGAGGGLMGIRHEGKQASKPQQKPQTWPGVKHDSLVTCQAASGVITPNTADYITLNSRQSEPSDVLTGLNISRKCAF